MWSECINAGEPPIKASIFEAPRSQTDDLHEGSKWNRGEWMVVKGEQRELLCLRETELKVPCSQKFQLFKRN